MLFNSVAFALFLPLVFVLYWFVTRNNLQRQNALLLIASYFFYSCWDWRFLFLLLFSTFLDFYNGLKIESASSERMRRFWLWLSIIINLGFLGIFKYYNFFADSFAALVGQFGFHVHPYTISVILPVGISFYTFHGLSYIIDIYKRRIEAEKNVVEYSVFVSFFPLLVAGPIERATHLLPQIKRPRIFVYAKAVDGLRQILWGLFKKVVIADNCATYANMIFNHTADYDGSTLVFGAIAFAFQIYGDFSGYSDIALGTARLFGIELLRNFAFPYFSRDIAEFWRRWHISLSSWFRDYLYIPLGGSSGGTWMRIRNTFIIFLVSGFWHGANWTFIVWGGLNAVYFLPLLLTNRNRTNMEIVAQGKSWPSLSELGSMLLTFAMTVLAWIFFRAASLHEAFAYIKKICSTSFISLQWWHQLMENKMTAIPLVLLLLIFLLIEWFGREQQFAIQHIHQRKRWQVWGFYYFLVVMIFLFAGSNQQFIYFQF